MKRYFTLVALAFVVACGKSSTGPAPLTVTGTWRGSADIYTITLTLHEDTDGQISGDGYTPYQGSRMPITVNGTHAGTDVVFAVNMYGSGYVVTYDFVGTMTSSIAIAGQLNRSGMISMPITFATYVP